MSERTDPVDLVFDLATELALVTECLRQVIKYGPTDYDRFKSTRVADAQAALARFKAWCDEGPDA